MGKRGKPAGQKSGIRGTLQKTSCIGISNTVSDVSDVHVDTEVIKPDGNEIGNDYVVSGNMAEKMIKAMEDLTQALGVVNVAIVGMKEALRGSSCSVDAMSSKVEDSGLGGETTRNVQVDSVERRTKCERNDSSQIELLTKKINDLVSVVSLDVKARSVGKNGYRRDITCYNCGGKGHIKKYCRRAFVARKGPKLIASDNLAMLASCTPELDSVANCEVARTNVEHLN